LCESLLLADSEACPLAEAAKGGVQIKEQLNIVGKRSGEGFVAHKSRLINALSRSLADRVSLMDFEIGRKGLLNYIRALNGSNIIKIVPASVNGDASEAQVAEKRLKVVCGTITSFLSDKAWIGENTPFTLAEVRVSANNTIVPNLGNTELAEALGRVLPFTATEDARPTLQCVLFKANEGKLTLTSADGFRLAIANLDFEGEGEALVNRDDLKGIANALRKAKRVKLGFEATGDSLDGTKLVIDTEAIRYTLHSAEGQFPDCQKVIPTDFSTTAHLDTVEAIKTLLSFRALSDNPKSYPVDLTVGEGKIVMANPDDKGKAVIPADTDGQCSIRVEGKYLADILRACGGMVDFRLVNPYSPMLFVEDGYQVVVMPMMSTKAEEQAKQDREAKAVEVQAEAETKPSGEAEAVAEAENIIKTKPKRSRKREKVAVA
jgi:DNA polymerase-3 subunit beta